MIATSNKATTTNSVMFAQRAGGLGGEKGEGTNFFAFPNPGNAGSVTSTNHIITQED